MWTSVPGAFSLPTSSYRGSLLLPKRLQHQLTQLVDFVLLFEQRNVPYLPPAFAENAL